MFQIHEIVDDDSNTEVEQEHEAEEDVQHEEGSEEPLFVVPDWLRVRFGRVTRGIHHIHPGLCRRDLKERKQGVPDVVKVLWDGGCPPATLFDAERSILDQRLTVLLALARRPALSAARKTSTCLAVCTSGLAEVGMSLTIGPARRRFGVRDSVRAEELAATHRGRLANPADCAPATGHGEGTRHGVDVGLANLFVLQQLCRDLPRPASAVGGELLLDGVPPRTQPGRRVPAVSKATAAHADGRVGASPLPLQSEVGL
mmetsp:Transcript_98681/g.228716  ORF Transcript_98681/g.228716 Transcript_98681/m.228716 type:complete len:258 (-) Transcript_98681:122-895(-)